MPINLKDELEELGERCEVYCLCKTPYDALRPMISCDKCEGWFHYDCCGMAPPTEEEPEDPDVHFTCPPCCESNGSEYKPFRPLPVKKQRGSSSEERGDEKADAERLSSDRRRTSRSCGGSDLGPSHQRQEEAKEEAKEEPEPEAEPMETDEKPPPEAEAAATPVEDTKPPKKEVTVEEEKKEAPPEEPARGGRTTRRSRR